MKVRLGTLTNSQFKNLTTAKSRFIKLCKKALVIIHQPNTMVLVRQKVRIPKN
jgi:hypothetical protein